MSILNLGDVAVNSTIYVPFHTFDSNDPSASVTITGLAVTDIEIYKDGSVTQRASDAGYTLLDTDGIDFDGTTGLHGFSIDLSDNSDAGFYAAGSTYWIAVASITVDAATINFWAAYFTIDRTGGTATIITDTEAVLTDTEAILTDAEAILVDTSTTLDTVVDSILVDTEAIITDTEAILTDAEAILVDTSTTLDTVVDAVLVDTEAIIADTELVLTDTEAILTDAEAILVDTTALNDTARGEPGQGAPGVSETMATKIDYLYKSWRNLKDNDGSTTQLYDDAGTTVDQKQTTSEAGGTVTKAEWVSGP